MNNIYCTQSHTLEGCSPGFISWRTKREALQEVSRLKNVAGVQLVELWDRHDNLMIEWSRCRNAGNLREYNLIERLLIDRCGCIENGTHRHQGWHKTTHKGG